MEILRKWAKPVLATLCALFTALACIFPLARAYGLSVNAFDVISYSGADMIITGVVGILALVYGVIALVMIVMATFANKGKIDSVPAISCVLTLVYAIMSFVLGGVGNIAFVPFILVAVFTVCYYLSDKVLKK